MSDRTGRSDQQLLQEYRATSSRQALGELISRHVDMVYSTALRGVHDRQLAEDVTQAVFVVLVEKAKSLGGGVVPAGWLFKATRLAVADALRKRYRRERHEGRAAMERTARLRPDSQDASGPGAAGPPWSQVSPHLNDAIASLSDKDRDAIVLRFLEGKSTRDVSGALGVSEDAAKQRVSRALAKLRAYFARRGLTMSALTLATLVATHASRAAPPHVGGSALAAAFAPAAAGHSAGGAGVADLARGVGKALHVAKLKLAGAIAAAGVLAAAGGAVTVARIESRGASARHPPPLAAPAAGDLLLPMDRYATINVTLPDRVEVPKMPLRGRTSEIYGLVHFDLSGLTAPPAKAVLRMRVDHIENTRGATPPARVVLYRLTTDWDAGATWNRAKGAAGSPPTRWIGGAFTRTITRSRDIDPQPVGSADVALPAKVGENLGIDVTGVVRGWVGHAYANDGLLIRVAQEAGTSNQANFDTEGQPPRLVVTPDRR